MTEREDMSWPRGVIAPDNTVSQREKNKQTDNEGQRVTECDMVMYWDQTQGGDVT